MLATVCTALLSLDTMAVFLMPVVEVVMRTGVAAALTVALLS